MKVRVPDYFKEFKCIGSDCPSTCCEGWGIVIDDEMYEDYKSVKGDFGKRLKSNIIIDEDGDRVFTLKGDNTCSFLNENKLCDIYTEIGEEYLCYTCKQYPRYTEEFGNLKEIGISLSCPEAARIMLKDNKKVTFELSEDNEKISSYNDINATLFYELMECRTIILNLLQREDLTLDKKLSLILIFSKEIQVYVDKFEISKIRLVKEKYLKEDTINYILENLNKPSENMKYTYMKEYFDVINNLEHIKEDPLEIENLFKIFYEQQNEEFYINKEYEFNNFYKEKYFKFQNICVYFIFRYFMKAVFDYDILSKVKFTILSYLVIKNLSMRRWIEKGTLEEKDIMEISYMYSKDIEHLEENIETLAEIFETNDKFNVEDILNILNC